MAQDKKVSLNKMWREMGKPDSFAEFCKWYNSANNDIGSMNVNIVPQPVSASSTQPNPIINPATVQVTPDTPIISSIGAGNNVWVAVGVGVAVLAGVYLLIYKKPE